MNIIDLARDEFIEGEKLFHKLKFSNEEILNIIEYAKKEFIEKESHKILDEYDGEEKCIDSGMCSYLHQSICAFIKNMNNVILIDGENIDFYERLNIINYTELLKIYSTIFNHLIPKFNPSELTKDKDMAGYWWTRYGEEAIECRVKAFDKLIGLYKK